MQTAARRRLNVIDVLWTLNVRDWTVGRILPDGDRADARALTTCMTVITPAHYRAAWGWGQREYRGNRGRGKTAVIEDKSRGNPAGMGTKSTVTPCGMGLDSTVIPCTVIPCQWGP